MRESVAGNGMLVFMILEVRQLQGAQVLYITVGVQWTKEVIGYMVVKKLRGPGASHHDGL